MPMLDPAMFNPSTFNPQGVPGWLVEILANQGAGAAPGPGGFPVQENPAAMQANASAPMPQPQAVAPPQQQGPGLLGMLSNGISQNPLTLMALGAGISQGGFGRGLEMAVPAAMADQKTKLTSQNQNLTYKALIKKGIDPETARAATVNPTLLQSLLSNGSTDDIKEFEYFKKNGGQGTFEQWMEKKRATSGEYGMTPIWGVGPDGKPAVLQLGKSGNAKQSALPPGFELSRDPVKIEGPTGTVILDPQTRQQVGFIPKDVQGAAAANERGAMQGKAQSSMPTRFLQATQTVNAIDKLLEHKGLDAIVGPIDQFRPSWTLDAEGRDALARFNQIHGKAFLEAYGMLKGGGPITDIEGTKAGNAMARLERAQDENAFKEALKDFRDAVRDGMKKLQDQASGTFGSSPQATANPASNLKAKYGLE